MRVLLIKIQSIFFRKHEFFSSIFIVFYKILKPGATIKLIVLNQ